MMQYKDISEREEWIQIRNALADAFRTYNDLRDLTFHMGENLESIAPRSNTQAMTLDIVEWAQVNNKKQILITTALKIRPENKELLAYVHLYGYPSPDV